MRGRKRAQTGTHSAKTRTELALQDAPCKKRVVKGMTCYATSLLGLISTFGSCVLTRLEAFVVSSLVGLPSISFSMALNSHISLPRCRYTPSLPCVRDSGERCQDPMPSPALPGHS